MKDLGLVPQGGASPPIRVRQDARGGVLLVGHSPTGDVRITGAGWPALRQVIDSALVGGRARRPEKLRGAVAT
jgi:hypothetical protein